MPTEHLGEIAALGTAVCWTATAMVFESAGKRVGSLAVNGIRLAMAFGLLALFSALRRGQPLPLDAGLRAWILLGLSGLVGFTIGDLCLFRALVVLGSRLAVLLMALVPPLAALLGWVILGERLTALDALGMALTVGGVVWVVRERAPDPKGAVARPSRSGILLGLGGAFGQALGLVLSKLGMGAYDPFSATEIRVIAGALGFAALFFCVGWWPRVRAAMADRGAMARITAGAVFGPFLGVSLSLIAIQRTSAGVAATIMAITPVLILPPTVLINKERVSLRAAAGAGVAVAGTALLFLR